MSKPYSEDTKELILQMHEYGLSGRAIARSLGLGKTAVNDFIAYSQQNSKAADALFSWNDAADEAFSIPAGRPESFPAGNGFVGISLYDDFLYKNSLDFMQPMTSTKAFTPYNPVDGGSVARMLDEIKRGIDSINKPDNSRILVISDMHIPYHHKQLLPFLQRMKDKYSPTRVICIGDEVDGHALSFHDSDPDLYSAGHELAKTRSVIEEVYNMFPTVDLLDSNHGSLAYRRAKAHGIPQHYIKSYNDVLGVGDGWKWHHELVIKLPNKQDCYFHHGKMTRGIALAQQMGMNVVQGHFHSEFNINYYATPFAKHFSMQVGCLIDDKSRAMAYNKLTPKRPIIGCGVIIDSIPILESMDL